MYPVWVRVCRAQLFWVSGSRSGTSAPGLAGKERHFHFHARSPPQALLLISLYSLAFITSPHKIEKHSFLRPPSQSSAISKPSTFLITMSSQDNSPRVVSEMNGTFQSCPSFTFLGNPLTFCCLFPRESRNQHSPSQTHPGLSVQFQDGS